MRHPILAALLLFPAVGRSAEAAGVSIDHKPVGCMVVERFSRIEARFDAAGDVARARVHFRAAGGPYWYFVEMRPEAGTFYGVLPKPKKETKKIEYYVEVLDKAFAASRTAEYAPDVVEPGTCRKDMLMAAVMTTAKVAVGAATGAPVIPAGFSAAGIVPAAVAGASAGTGGATGTAAAGAGATGAGAAGGISTGVVVGVVGAGAAVAVVAATAGGGGSSGPAAPATSSPAGSTTTTAPPGTSPGTTTTTTTPGPSNLTGRWAGTGPDGLVAVTNPECVLEFDLFYDLTQSGSSVSASGTAVVRKTNPNRTGCPPVGTQGPMAITGTASGGNFSGTLVLGSPPQARAALTGTYTATRMSGTWVDLDVPNETGTWGANRQ